MSKWGALVAALAALSVGREARAQEPYKIIVNPANRIASATKEQVGSYFLDRTTWEDGQPVLAVDLPPASPVRETFSRDVLNMTPASVVAKWRTSSGFGRGDPPPSVATDREVLAFVRLKPGAIGYVSSSADTGGLKVISIGKADLSAGSKQILDVGGQIPMPERLAGTAPSYPLVAKMAHVLGDVDLEIVIGAKGDVESARVVRSVPMLDASAIDAVKKWKYKPTVLNGTPIPVKAKVRVAFTM